MAEFWLRLPTYASPNSVTTAQHPQSLHLGGRTMDSSPRGKTGHTDPPGHTRLTLRSRHRHRYEGLVICRNRLERINSLNNLSNERESKPTASGAHNSSDARSRYAPGNPAAFTLRCVLRYQGFQISLVHGKKKHGTSFYGESIRKDCAAPCKATIKRNPV